MDVFAAVQAERNKSQREEADEDEDEHDPGETADDEFRKGVHVFLKTWISAFQGQIWQKTTLFGVFSPFPSVLDSVSDKFDFQDFLY